MPYVYVKHPVSRELKAEVKKVYNGHTILDIKFKPENLPDGDVVFDTDNPPEVKIVTKRKPKAS